MGVIGIPLLQLLNTIVHLYVWVVIVDVILNWLILFNIVNPYNKLVLIISNFTNRATEPALAPLRRILPNFNGLDLSPLVLILGLYLIEGIIQNLLLKIIL